MRHIYLCLYFFKKKLDIIAIHWHRDTRPISLPIREEKKIPLNKKPFFALSQASSAKNKLYNKVITNMKIFSRNI